MIGVLVEAGLDADRHGMLVLVPDARCRCALQDLRAPGVHPSATTKYSEKARTRARQKRLASNASYILVRPTLSDINGYQFSMHAGLPRPRPWC